MEGILTMIGIIIQQTQSSGTTVIEVTNEELAAIMQLKKNYRDIATLIESGVFDFKNGQAVLHRDQDGKLRKVDINLTRFRV